MKDILRWFSAILVGIAWVVLMVCLLSFQVSDRVRDPLCPVVFDAKDDHFFEVPSDVESDIIPFDLFCILIKGNPDIDSLNREISPSVSSVTINIVARFKGYDRPVQATKQITPPAWGQFDFSEQKPRFGDGEIVLYVVRDDALAVLAIAGAAVAGFLLAAFLWWIIGE